MPVAMAKAQEQIGWKMPQGFTLADLSWGLLPKGHQLGQPVPLFPRLEVEPKE